MGKSRIYLSPPHMNARERQMLLEAFDSNWIAPVGPDLNAFEREVADYVGVQHAAALSSGTAAIHLALEILGVGVGDEVIVATMTFAASANPVRYLGATPIFVDSESETWNMDPGLLEEAIESGLSRGKRPKAIVPVDLYGQCANYERILAVAKAYEIPVVEDAAEALGASYRGAKAGSFGDFGVLSFNGNKIITTSGGGMLLSNNGEHIARARHLATQAREPEVHYEHRDIGYNYRLSNLLAAIGRAQLEDLPNKVERRREIFKTYQEGLSDLPGIEFMPQDPAGESNCWLSCFTLDPEQHALEPETIRLALEAENIESRPLWKPMHLQPSFADCTVFGGQVSERLFQRGLCLPSGTQMTAEDLERTVSVIRSLYRDT